MDKETYEKACESLHQLSDVIHQHFHDNAGECTPYVLLSMINGELQMIGNTQQADVDLMLNIALTASAAIEFPVIVKTTH